MTSAAPWLRELARTWPGLFASYGPSAPLDARTRERIIMAVTTVNGSRSCGWVHRSWQDFLGEGEPIDEEALFVEYAIACAGAGVPLATDDLRAVVPAAVVAAVRAAVAHGVLANVIGGSVDDSVARLTGRKPFAPLALARELATVAVAAPVAAPVVGAAVAMRLIRRAAPPMPTIEKPLAGEANLLVDLLSAAAPAYLANAAVRLLAIGGPIVLTIGVRAGRSGATIRLGRGRVRIDNDIADDAVVVIEGEIEPLLEVATGSLVRELRGIRIRGT